MVRRPFILAVGDWQESLQSTSKCLAAGCLPMRLSKPR